MFTKKKDGDTQNIKMFNGIFQRIKYFSKKCSKYFSKFQTRLKLNPDFSYAIQAFKYLKAKFAKTSESGNIG